MIRYIYIYIKLTGTASTVKPAHDSAALSYPS